MKITKLLLIALASALLLSGCAFKGHQGFDDYLSQKNGQEQDAEPTAEVEWSRLRSAWPVFDTNREYLKGVGFLSEACKEAVCRELFIQYIVGAVADEQIEGISEKPDSGTAQIELVLKSGESVFVMMDNPKSENGRIVAVWKEGEPGDEVLYSSLPD